MLFNFTIGLRTSLIVTLASVIALVVNMQEPWWAAMSAMTVANADWTNVWRKGMQRVIGTIAGGFCGYWIAIAVKNFELFQWTTLGIMAALAIYKRMASPNYAYAWLMGIVTAMLAIYFAMVEIDSLFFLMVDRTLTVAIGVATATVVSYSFLENSSIGVGLGPFIIPNIDTMDKSWVVALCLSGAVVAVLAPIVYAGHDLSAMIQIIITSLVVLYGPVVSVKQFAITRSVGCFAGALMGFVLIGLGLQSFFWWVLLVALGLFFLGAVQAGKSYWTYAGQQGGYAYVIAALASSGPVDNFNQVLDRQVGVILGAIIAVCVLVVIRIWQGADFPDIEHMNRKKIQRAKTKRT
ncbi:Fusaric acid resistance protein family protein [Pseudovibrio axinellae]|uniref:Fusaric acid resistance protein family protein n=1 Tax=Pseudovibrio axinellae TaxID=989403 RepID=A0A161V8K6_9HYPH|nr:FUSC family protein [Pseudovibrio axinellae]KZL21309.1 Fusaric acid resistance protein family protein [Pseudovibrio axinellae]SEQ95627.1 Fusaric acid resistance protein-like [Pseudovibrio axinellae]